jgi:hypothetical protein
MSLGGFGRAVFALALAGLSVSSVMWGDFAYVWQPVPAWVPGRVVLAHASGLLLLGCAAGLLWRRTLARASVVLSVYCLASMLLVHVPGIASKPHEEGLWFGLGEIAVIIAGARILFASAAPRHSLNSRIQWGRGRATTVACE